MSRGIKLPGGFLVLIVSLLLSASISFAGAKTTAIDLQVRGNVLSVNLQDIPLRMVLEELSRIKGIWFQADESLLAEKISVQFEGLSLRNGLERLLARTSHSLIFDRNNRLAGLVILGRAVSRGLSVRKTAGTGVEILSAGAAQQSIAGGLFEIVPNSPPPGPRHARPIDTTIMKNAPPPENPDAGVIDTTVVENCPPPETHVAEPIDTTIVRNCPPPGPK